MAEVQAQCMSFSIVIIYLCGRQWSWSWSSGRRRRSAVGVASCCVVEVWCSRQIFVFITSSRQTDRQKILFFGAKFRRTAGRRRQGCGEGVAVAVAVGGRAAGSGEGGFVGRILLLIASTSAFVGGGCHDVKVAVNMSMVDVIVHSDHLFPMIVLGLVHGEIFF